MSDQNPRSSNVPATWWHKHGLTVLGLIMIVLFTLVIGVQVAC